MEKYRWINVTKDVGNKDIEGKLGRRKEKKICVLGGAVEK